MRLPITKTGGRGNCINGGISKSDLLTFKDRYSRYLNNFSLSGVETKTMYVNTNRTPSSKSDPVLTI